MVHNVRLPSIPGQLTELALDVAEIVGVDLEAEVALESNVVAIWLVRGLVTTGLGPLALLGGWIGAVLPIHRQMQREAQCGLVCLFIFGSGRRYKGLPLEDGCGHGHGHVEGGKHGCEEAGKELYNKNEYYEQLFSF